MTEVNRGLISKKFALDVKSTNDDKRMTVARGCSVSLKGRIVQNALTVTGI